MSGVLAVIPVYGEDSRLSEVIANVRQLQIPMLVVNDGNGPELTHRLSADGIPCIEFVNNRGVGAATRAGLHLATNSGYDGALAVDADMAHDIASIASVRDAALRNPTRPVITNRFGWPSRAYVPEEKLAANGFACALFALVTGHSWPDTSCGLRYYPSGVACDPWDNDGYGFVPEFLATLVTSDREYELIDVFVDYGGRGPFLTRASELRDLLEWARRCGVAPGVWQQLEPLTTAGAVSRNAPLVFESSKGRWSFDAVPGRDAWLISGDPPPPPAIRSHGLPSLHPSSVGIIPDGGRRWASREGLPLREAYRRSLEQIHKALTASCDNLGDVGIYCLSAANLARPDGEVADLLAVMRPVAEDMATDGLRPVIYGDLHTLPPDTQDWATRLNLAASDCRGPLTVMVTGFSPAWEASLLDRSGSPWRYGLSAPVLARVMNMRFALLLRSGGASTLSDFLPAACSYSVISIRNELFNDIDLVTWLHDEKRRLDRVQYGT